MKKVDYSKYLDKSKCNFKLPICTDIYTATYNIPFNFTDITSEGNLNIDLDALIEMVLKDKKESGLDNYTFYNFEDFFNELININMLDSYEYDTEDLKALYSCVIENLKKIKE